MRLNVSTGRTLTDEIERAHTEIDAAAGAARARYMTTVAGQTETYAAKAADAAAYRSAGYPLPATDFAWVAAEAQATSKTPQEAADVILATRDAWTTIGVAIERDRMAGKTAASAEATIAGVIRVKLAALAALGEL